MLAYQKIKALLIDGTLAPGSFISEDILEEKAGSGRTPVREAIQRLTKEHFLEVYPRQGIYVTDITLNLLNEIYDFREVNEPYIAKKSCEIIDQNVLIDIKQKFLNPPADNSEEKRICLINLDTLLHATILSCCTNRFLADTMRIVLDHDARIKHFSYREKENDEISIPEHIEIIDSLLSKDPDRIYTSSLNHVVNSRQNVVKNLLEFLILQ